MREAGEGATVQKTGNNLTVLISAGGIKKTKQNTTDCMFEWKTHLVAPSSGHHQTQQGGSSPSKTGKKKRSRLNSYIHQI